MIRSLSALLLAGSLAACVSVLPDPKPPEGLYRFGAMDAALPLEANVTVHEPEASRLFGGRAIASEDSSGALRLVRGVEWADSATQLMQSAMLDALGDNGKGVAVAYESGVAADYELVWRAKDFTLSGSTAHCALEATLVDARTRTVVAQTNVTSSASAKGEGNAARARALAQAGQACVQDVAEFVADRAAAKD